MKVVTPKDFFTSPLGKLVLLVLIMVGCWCVLCVYLSANSAVGTWFPTDAQMDRAVKDIKAERVKYNTASAEMAEIEKLRAKYNGKLDTFWQVERDGAPETELRTLLSDTAAVLDITMTRLDNVRISSKITDELYYADLSFQFTDTYDKIVTFISQIESTQPRLGWRTLTINAENNRNRNNNMLMGGARIIQTNASSSGTTTTVQQKYRLDATVRVIRYMPVSDPNAPATAAAGTKAQTGTAAQGAATKTDAKQGTAAQPAQGAAGATAAVGAVGDPTKGKPTPAQGAAGVTPGAAPNANAGIVPNQVNQGPQGAQQMQPGMGMQGGFGGMQGGMGGFGGMDMQGGFGGMQPGMGGFGGMDMQGGFGGMQGGFGGMQGGMGGFGGMDMQGGFGGMQGGFGGMQGGMGMQPGNMQQGGMGMQPAGNAAQNQRPANNAAQNQRPAGNAGAANNVAPAAQQAQQGAARN